MVALLIAGGLDNDEFLGLRSVPPILTAGGVGVPLGFAADGGEYRARLVTRG